MTESTQVKMRTVKIKSMGGKFATGGFFVADGVKISPEDICSLPADLAKVLEDSDYVEFTNKTPNCSVIRTAQGLELMRG